MARRHERLKRKRRKFPQHEHLQLIIDAITIAAAIARMLFVIW
jgi:hypothetical protein